MIEYQQTVSRIHSFEGVGLHTGAQVKINIKPSAAGTGIKFLRVDLPGTPIIDAIATNVTSTQRGTVISKGEASVSTIEHLMSALYAFKIDNALIEIDGPELPILDGSSSIYALQLSTDPLLLQDKKRTYFAPQEPIHYSDSASGSNISIYPQDHLSLEVMIDFNSKFLGTQFAQYKEQDNYLKEIAPSRTFVFTDDLIPLYKAGLIKGGDLSNAIVIAENPLERDDLRELQEYFNFSSNNSINSGVLNKEGLIFYNECARHKLLDLIGDIALSGQRIKGRIIAHKPGHKINTETAKILVKMAKEIKEISTIPVYDPNAEPVVDINGIKKLLPHRPPFLMVDRIISMEKESVVGIKTIGVNEGFFIGHFPDEPVMPGVLIIEAMAQVGGILVLSDIEEPEKHSTYFAKIDNAKFKRKVVPGDVMVIKLQITNPLRRSIVSMKGEVYIGNTLACEADLMAQVIKNK